MSYTDKQILETISSTIKELDPDTVRGMLKQLMKERDEFNCFRDELEDERNELKYEYNELEKKLSEARNLAFTYRARAASIDKFSWELE